MNKVLQTAVSAALDQPQIIDTTVSINVRVRAAEGIPLGHLVVEALQEFIDLCPSEAQGTFESRAGLGVIWKTTNYRLPNAVAEAH